MYFTSFIVEHNLPFNVCRHTGKLFRKMFPDSDIAQHYACSSTKATAIMNLALEPECAEDMYKLIRTEKRPYSILVDESNDIMCEKECAILARYYSEAQDKVADGFIDMPVCNDAKAENIFNCIASSMDEKGINWSNCIGFSSDNCNVMIGKNNSVLSRVKAQAPHIYSVGCPSHLVNICAKTAAKELSMSPEELIIDIYYYFEKSSKRREDLKEFQEFCNVAQQRVQKHCPTRWLSLGKSLDHLLNQWPAFSSYFQSHSENQKSRDIEKRLTDPMMKIYTCFLHNATQSFDKFNLIFQDKAPILFKLNGSVEELLHDIGSRFIVPKVLREQNVQEIDVSNPEVHCADENLFVGFLTRRHLVSEEEIPSDKTRQFFKDARSFYVRSFQKVKEKFPVRDKVLTNLSVVNPENQEDVTPEQILTLAERFPNAVKADVKEQLHLEVLDYTSTNLEKVIPNYRNLAVDEFWGRLSKVKSVNTGQVRFKELCQLMKLLLVLPNSNCDVERAFSLVRHIKTEFRCQMSHQTLVNLMSCKINKFIDIECHDLEVPGKLLKSAKQAASTYNESLKSLEKEKE